MPIENKRGPLSAEEVKFIDDNLSIMTDVEIAKVLNRTITPVAKRRAQKPTIDSTYGEAPEEAVLQLKTMPFWLSLKEQLTSDEIETFKKTWTAYCTQFSQQGLQPLDHLMIKDLIVLEILLDRALRERRDNEEEVNHLRKAVKKELGLPPDQRDTMQIQSYNNQISALLAARQHLEKSSIDIQTRKDNKLRDLKATRDQRYKQIEESKKNIFELIRELSSYKVRKAEGRRNALCQKCADIEKRRLSQPRTYRDGTVDIPLLTPDVILEYNNDDTENSEI